MVLDLKKVCSGLFIGIYAITTIIQLLIVLELLKFVQAHDALSILTTPEPARLAVISFLILVGQVIGAIYGYDRHRKCVLLTPEKSKFVMER